MKHTLSIVALALASLVYAGNSGASTPTINTGTLRCTLGPGVPEKTREPRELSCVFKPLVGTEAVYSGEIRKLQDPTQTAEALVFVWAVFATDIPVAIQALEGRYTGVIETQTESGKPGGKLTGGKNSSVELRPLTRLPDNEQNLAPLILELDLKSIKA